MIKRPRLTEKLVDPSRQSWLIEAGAGFGKSVLLDELRRSLVSSLIVVRAPIVNRGKLGFLAELAEAASRAGHREDAAALINAEGNPTAIAEILVASDRSLAIDDLHAWDAEVADFGVLLFEHLREQCKVVMCGRTMPTTMRDYADSVGMSLVGPHDLAFTEAEVSELLGDNAGDLATTLHKVSDGWPIAIGTVANRLDSAPDPTSILQQLGRHETLIDGLFRQQLDGVDEGDRAALAQLVALPFFDEGVCRRIAAPKLLDRLGAAGVPLIRRGDGWYEFSGQFRAAVARIGAKPETLRSDVIAYYVDKGEIQAAIDICVAAGEYESAAEVIARLSFDQQLRLEPQTLNAAMVNIDAAVETAPRALFVQALVNASFGRTSDVLATLERAQAIWERNDPDRHEEGHQELLLEVAFWRINSNRVEEAAKLLTDVAPLVESSSNVALQARVHDIRGLLHHITGSLDQATEELSEALRLWRGLAESRPATATAVRLATGVLAHRSLRNDALALLDSLPSLGPVSFETAARLALERSLLLPYLGRAREVPELVREPRRIGRLLGIDWLVGWTYWSEIIAASFCYDATEVQRLVDEFDETGYVVVNEINQGMLWGEVAEALARCGRLDSARVAFNRSAATEGIYPLFVSYTHASIEARGGNAADALKLIADIEAMDGVLVDYKWRLALLRAFAQHRIGDSAAASASLAESVQMARELGQASLPDIVDGQLIAQIQAGASASDEAQAMIEVALFDRFELRRNGAETSLPAGRVSNLLMLLVLHGSHLTLDQVVDALWSDASLQQGRKRLRNVLNRLHEAAGVHLIERDGDSLHLVTGVASDFGRALELAESALKPGSPLGALDIALQACDRELLPEIRYEDWAEEARAAHLQRVIRLHDAAASAAEATGEIDRAVAALTRAHEIDLWRKHRLDAAADLLRKAGREAAASVLVAE